MQIRNHSAVDQTRERLAQLGRMLFDRHLTDACGGNMSARVGDLVCMSPTQAGQKRQWQLAPEDVLVTDMDGNILEGEGGICRESNAHYGLHRLYGDYGTAVIHAHPRNLMVFVSLAQPMPPVLEANMKYGVVECVEYAPATTPELAKNIIEGFKGLEERIRHHAAGVIAPWHGLFLMGKDLDAAFDAVERFDTNAYCYLMAHSAFSRTPDMLTERQRGLEEAYHRFKDAHKE